MSQSVMCVLAMFTVIGVAPTLSAQDADAEQWRRLQGVWTVTAGEQNGRPNDSIKGGTLAVTERAFTLRTATGNELKGQLRIDASVTPNQLDFVHENGTVWQAIYTVTGDVFRLNYVEAGERIVRPRLFATSNDTPGSIVVMRRAKP